MVNCPYSTRCSSEGTCCGHCGNNHDLKEDWFIPRRRHHYYHPNEYPYIRWGSTNVQPSWTPSQGTGYHYKER